ncbi:MAG: hypothetical protein U9Q33_06735 [Campylobacterota bacterium]|nr:hypothetical protein [Campylobacterota bacterium]
MNTKLITALMNGRKAASIIEDLKEKHGIITANRSNARGTTIVNISGEEMEVLTVLVDSSQADEIFEYIYTQSEIYKPNSGLMYQQDISRSSKYSLPKE